MKLTFAPVALLGGMLLSGTTFAVPLVVDFETPTSFASIAEHYNGGVDSADVAGANLGVSFGPDALALRNDELGPYFGNAPSPVGVLTAVFEDAAMNVAIGFTGMVSFSYSSNDAGEIGVWSGMNGTGTRLGGLALMANASGCDAATPLCTFGMSSFDLGANVAQSITFGDAAGITAVFDNVTVTAVPEPETYALMGLGLVAVAGMAGRARRRAAVN
jgi:hypothetical protein